MILGVLAIIAVLLRACLDSKEWRKRGQENQALGRPKGGFSTKIHAICDSHGSQLRFILTDGQRNDCTQALALPENISGDALLADKGYGTNYIVKAAENMEAMIVIPPKKNRIIQREYDKDLYKERNLIERLFNKLKNFRRVATRYDKLASSFMDFINIAAICIWLR